MPEKQAAGAGGSGVRFLQELPGHNARMCWKSRNAGLTTVAAGGRGPGQRVSAFGMPIACSASGLMLLHLTADDP
jgi:hypothetical protein